MNASIKLDTDVKQLQAASSTNRTTVLIVRSDPNVLTGTVVSNRVEPDEHPGWCVAERAALRALGG